MSFPPRPAAIAVDGLDPCDLLDSEQQAVLGLRRPTPGQVTVDGRPSSVCTFLGANQVDYNVQIIPIDTAVAAQDPASSITQVNGFGAVQNVPPEAGPDRPVCQIAIDAAPGISIRLQANANAPSASIGTDELCRRATEAASMVMTTVVTTTH